VGATYSVAAGRYLILEAISLKQQSLSTVAPTLEAQCAHHLGLLNHKSDAQRRESLAYLTTAIMNNPPMAPLPQPASVIIPVAQRLILDGTNSVRQQLLKLLQSLPQADIASHADQLLLHTRAAMTHLANEIRTFGLDVLDWLLGQDAEMLLEPARLAERSDKQMVSTEVVWESRLEDAGKANERTYSLSSCGTMSCASYYISCRKRQQFSALAD
jgi:hypothetical protein